MIQHSVTWRNLEVVRTMTHRATALTVNAIVSDLSLGKDGHAGHGRAGAGSAGLISSPLRVLVAHRDTMAVNAGAERSVQCCPSLSPECLGRAATGLPSRPWIVCEIDAAAPGVLRTCRGAVPCRSSRTTRSATSSLASPKCGPRRDGFCRSCKRVDTEDRRSRGTRLAPGSGMNTREVGTPAREQARAGPRLVPPVCASHRPQLVCVAGDEDQLSAGPCMVV